MRRYFLIIAVIVSAAAMAVSCSKPVPDDTDDQRNVAFEAWMSVYGDGAVKDESGIYIKKIDSIPIPGAVRPRDNDWVRVNYTFTNLATGNVFATRDAQVAKQMGVYQDYTHYAPAFEQRTSSSDSIMIKGVYYGLKNMREGEKWRLYIPFELAYPAGSSNYFPQIYGYGVSRWQVASKTPVIVDLELVEVIVNAVDYETDEVQRYAAARFGQGINDTVAEGVYFKHISYGLDTAHVIYSKDSTLRISYVGTFLDNFMFDTNIADSAIRRGRYWPSKKYLPVTTKYDVYEQSGSENDGVTDMDEDISRLKGFSPVYKKLRYGETVEVVMTSSNAFGYEGDMPSFLNTQTGEEEQAPGTIIPPYTPLRFFLKAMSLLGDGTQGDPYIPSGVIRDMGNKTDVWVTGYVVGAALGATLDGSEMQINVTTDTNILLADEASETDPNDCIAIELPEGPVRNALNLMTNRGLYKYKVTVRGNVRTYKGAPGVVDVTSYYVHSATGL